MKPTMTVEQAKVVLGHMDVHSHARFSPQEREAIIVLGVEIMAGRMTTADVNQLAGKARTS